MARQVARLPTPANGLDNLHPRDTAPDGTLTAVRNVLIDANGRLRNRKAMQKVANLPYPSAMFEAHDQLYIVAGGVLYTINPPSPTATPLAVIGLGLVSVVSSSWGVVLATSSGLYQVLPDDVVLFGVPEPSATPAVVETSEDVWKGYTGSIRVYVSHYDVVTGEESPQVLAGHVESLGGFMLTDIPASPYGLRVYSTEPDGEVARMVGEIPPGAVTATFNSRPVGPEAKWVNMASMANRGGHIVRAWKGRILVADDDTLWFSLPLAPKVYDPGYGFLRFDGRIRFVEALDNTLIVGDSMGVWMLQGADVSEMTKRQISTIAPWSGSMVVASSNFDFMKDVTAPVAVWCAGTGVYLTTPSGQVVPLQEDRIVYRNRNMHATMTAFVDDGIKQVLIAFDDEVL